MFKLTFADVFAPASRVSVESLSRDGRRVKRVLLEAEPPSPIKRRKQRETGEQVQTSDFGQSFEQALEGFGEEDLQLVEDSTTVDVGALFQALPKRRRYLTTDQPLKEWQPFRDEYLAEFIRSEGRGDSDTNVCYRCRNTSDETRRPLFRCLDCFSPDLVCEECCRTSHEDRPLDIIEKWNGKFFERVSLQSIGLVVRLGHQANESCPRPRILNNFTVLHTNGIHEVSVAFCNCSNRWEAGAEWRCQLLRRSWFPATHSDPHTCATFALLNTFHIMTLQGKVTLYDFYAGLEKLSNNAGLAQTGERYKEFARMIREWRHLKMLKRGGRGNDAKRTVEETRIGELAVECPACPRPGVNLPDGWQDAKPKNRYLYWLYLATDACFRLKRRLVSSEKRDPGLGTGWSYFVEDEPFREYLLSVTDQQEMSTCTGLGALDHANTRYSRGYASTGVGLGCCARHEMVQRNGVVDLQKGERYANMDYSFASLLRHHDDRLTKVSSYDIACQWYKNLVTRVKELPSLVRRNLESHKIYFVVPKLHIHGHNLACQLNFSLNWLWGAGRTDGEGIERGWAHLGPIATSTRDMGPGSRHDTMDDHFGHWNWVKLTGLGTLLWKRLKTAITQKVVHSRALADFTQQQGKEVTDSWVKMIKEWEEDRERPEKDRSVVNPFEMPKSGMTEHEVRLQISEEEAAQEAAGIPSIHDVSPGAFIVQGLELEQQQRLLKIDIKNKKFETAAQKNTLLENRTKLSRAIGKFRSLQAIYMPGALQLLEKRQSDAGVAEHAEQIPLVLPSALPATSRTSGCRQGLVEIELRLRESQLRNALNHLRNHLHMKSRLLTYRSSNVVHQGSVTRSQNLMKRNQRQIDGDTHKYQEAWEAMSNLMEGKEMRWRKLEKKDVRLMDEGLEDRALKRSRKKLGKNKLAEAQKAATLVSAAETEQERRLRDARARTGEGRRQISWIWMEGGTGELVDQKALEEVVRVEWCKAYARAKRWEEEVDLLKEEMRRCLVSLEWKACEWDCRGSYEGPLAIGKDAKHAEGVVAYAASQAWLFRAIAEKFRKLWSEVGEKEREIEHEGQEAPSDGEELEGGEDDLEEEEEEGDLFGAEE